MTVTAAPAVYPVAMIAIEVTSARSDYTVVVGDGILGAIDEILRDDELDPPRSIVTDANVGPLHGQRLARAMELDLFELAGGETGKRWDAVETTCRRWITLGLDRSTSALALGGGIVTDTVGFAASVFMRGSDWIAVPTTLLGMVDAAVGGKTGVNLPEGKNLVGAFWPPRLVVADILTLETLPARERRAGLAEVVKTAWIGDRDLVELIPAAGELSFTSLSPEHWADLVARSVKVNAEVVAADERE